MNRLVDEVEPFDFLNVAGEQEQIAPGEAEFSQGLANAVTAGRSLDLNILTAFSLSGDEEDIFQLDSLDIRPGRVKLVSLLPVFSPLGEEGHGVNLDQSVPWRKIMDNYAGTGRPGGLRKGFSSDL